MKPSLVLTASTVAVLVLACGDFAHGADLRNVLADYTITSWSKKDGLPSSPIRALAQDADGFLWLGADFGLVRFDGARFIPWNALHRTPLPQAPVQTLHVSRDGSLWVGFGGRGGISRIHGDQVASYGTADGLTPGVVNAIAEDRAGGIVAVCGGQLLRFLHGHWEKWDVRYGPPHGQVRTAYVGRSGDLFLVADAGIFRRRQGEETFRQLENGDAESPVQSIAEDRSGRLWTTHIIHGFRNIGEQQLHPPSSANGKGYRLLTDHVGNLWIATLGQGVWCVRTDQRTQSSIIERATDLTGLSNNSVYALLEDRDGNIWVGTTDGLNRLTADKMTQITNLGLATGLTTMPDGSVWVGTTDGMIRLSQREGTWRPVARRLRGLETRAMYADGNGALWVATDGGLQRIVSGPLPRVEAVPTGGLKRIGAMTSDGNGGLWLYDLDRGLVRWNSGHADAIALPPTLQRVRVGAMYRDRMGRIWLGFVQGQVAIIDADGAVRPYGAEDGLPGGVCHAIFEDDAGTLWIVNSLGLSRFSNGQFITLRHEHGFPANLTGIIEDEAGELWLGSASGILRINRGEFDRAVSGRPDQVIFNVYDTSDGVAGTTGWIGQPSTIRTTGGRLWFLTVEGLTIVDPRTLRASHAPEPVRIDDVVVNDGKLEPASELRLSAGTTRLEINYTVPDLTSPLKTRFRYRLEGFDTDWVDAGTRRQAIYTNLPARPYLFRVQANNQGGMWARPSVTWAFSIRPPFYQTLWFYCVSLGALVVFAWAAWRLRMTQLRRRFALLLGERVRLSREIHDTLLQSLVGVALQLDHLGTDLRSSPDATRAQFQRMRKQVEEYVREARESIWNLRSSALQRCDLVTALRQSGERAVENEVAFDFRVTGAPHRCSPVVEEQVLRIGQEAVTNAIRHSQARRIHMELHYDDAALRLRVSDDGQGFEPDAVYGNGSGHYGVLSMRERAETAGGAFRISSATGTGTIVETIVPTSPAT